MTEALIALVFGLLIGSFLNVCIYRWPRDLSVVRPRSHCPACDKTIAWYDNVPLLSYVLLRGKCRHCGTGISVRYPVVELVTGLLFFHFIRTLGLTPAGAKMCVFSAMLLALAISDLEERILPDEFTLGGAVVGLAFSFFVATPDISAQLLLWVLGQEPPARALSFIESAAGAALPAGLLWAAGWIYERVRHRDGLGLGDVKLIAMIGSFMGLRGALFALFLGSISGSVIGYSYIRLAKKDPATYELPFGTFIGIAGLVLALAGPALLP